MLDFAGKTAVVTGAAKGIGEAVVRAFSNSGAKVALLDVDETRGTAVATETGGHFIRCDVSKEADVRNAMHTAAQKYGGVDYLVNNAGIQRYSMVGDTTEEEWDLVMNVNLKSAFLCAKHAIPEMQKRGAGVIINMSSVQAFISQGNAAPYTTSKTAMLGLTRSIAADYSPMIRCVAVCPGTVDTPMLRDAIALSPDPAAVMKECVAMHLTARIGKPSEIAELVLYLCSDGAAFMTGHYVRIDGGLGVTAAGSKRD
ncbi:MAG: glucose 1-dehydrogenase [Candidatus Sumerlaeota bacterium]